MGQIQSNPNYQRKRKFKIIEGSDDESESSSPRNLSNVNKHKANDKFNINLQALSENNYRKIAKESKEAELMLHFRNTQYSKLKQNSIDFQQAFLYNETVKSSQQVITENKNSRNINFNLNNNNKTASVDNVINNSTNLIITNNKNKSFANVNNKNNSNNFNYTNIHNNNTNNNISNNNNNKNNDRNLKINIHSMSNTKETTPNKTNSVSSLIMINNIPIIKKDSRNTNNNQYNFNLVNSPITINNIYTNCSNNCVNNSHSKVLHNNSQINLNYSNITNNVNITNNSVQDNNLNNTNYNNSTNNLIRNNLLIPNYKSSKPTKSILINSNNNNSNKLTGNLSNNSNSSAKNNNTNNTNTNNLVYSKRNSPNPTSKSPKDTSTKFEYEDKSLNRIGISIIKRNNKNLEDRKLICDSLNKHFFMKNLSEENYTNIIKEMFLTQIEEGSILFSQGSVGSFFYVIKFGELICEINDNYIKSLFPWESFGELALLHNTTRTATIKAKKKSLCWCLDRRKFRKIIDQINSKNFLESKKFVKSIPVLKNLTNDLISILSSNLLKVFFDPNAFIIKAGDNSNCMYIIKEGEVEIKDKDKLLRVLGKNDYFGDYSILMNSKRSMDVISKTKTIVYCLTLETLMRMLGNNYQEHLVLSLIKNAFTNSTYFKAFNIELIDGIFDFLKVKKYSSGKTVVKAGSYIDSKIIVLLEGNLVDSKTKKIISKRGEIVFEKCLIKHSSKKQSFKVINDIIADPDCLICEADTKSFLNKVGMENFQEILTSFKLMNIFNSIPYFKYLNEKEKIAVKSKLTKVTFSAEDTIVTQGQIDEHLYIVYSGLVKAEKDFSTIDLNNNNNHYDYFGVSNSNGKNNNSNKKCSESYLYKNSEENIIGSYSGSSNSIINLNNQNNFNTISNNNDNNNTSQFNLGHLNTINKMSTMYINSNRIFNSGNLSNKRKDTSKTKSNISIISNFPADKAGLIKTNSNNQANYNTNNNTGRPVFLSPISRNTNSGLGKVKTLNFNNVLLNNSNFANNSNNSNFASKSNINYNFCNISSNNTNINTKINTKNNSSVLNLANLTNLTNLNNIHNIKNKNPLIKSNANITNINNNILNNVSTNNRINYPIINKEQQSSQILITNNQLKLQPLENKHLKIKMNSNDLINNYKDNVASSTKHSNISTIAYHKNTVNLCRNETNNKQTNFLLINNQSHKGFKLNKLISNKSVYKNASTNRSKQSLDEMRIIYFNDGCIFGEERTKYSIKCLTDVELYKISYKNLISYFSETMINYLKNNFYIEAYKESVNIKDLVYIRTLGESSFGSVCLVKCKFSHLYFTAKAIYKKSVKEEIVVKNLIKEKNISITLEHPFLAKLIKTIQTNDFVIFLKEYANGNELYIAMNELGFFSKFTSQFYTASICCALDYLHKKNLIYRDIKPENIIICENGYIKLIDYSTMKKIEDKTFTIIGTPNYIAYEVLMGEGYTFSADYWSLGICLYEFTCGRFPFDNETVEDPLIIYKNIIENELTFPSFIKDEKLIDLISNLITKSPSSRITTKSSISSNSWFEDFDFDKLMELRLCAPYFPKIKTNIKMKMKCYEEFLNNTISNYQHIHNQHIAYNKDNREEERNIDDLWYEYF